MQTTTGWLLDRAAPGLVLVDGAGAIAFANSRAEALVGYPGGGLNGRSMSSLLAEPCRSIFEQCTHRLRHDRGEPAARMTHVHVVRHDGSEFCATLLLSLVSGSGVDFVSATLVDEVFDAAALEHLSLALEAAPTGMILSDEHGTIILANAQTERLFGYARDELIGLSMDQLVPARSRTAHAELRRTFFRNAQTRAMGAGQDLYGARKDGSEVPVEIGLNALTLSDRRFVLSSVVDITERKRAMSHFHLALEAAPTGMLLVDERGRISFANAQIERIFGYARNDLMGQPIECLVPPPSRALHPSLRNGFFAEASSRPMGAGRDLYGLHRDGHQVPVEIALTTLDAREGRLVLTSVIDITERQRTERTLRDNEARYAELFDASPIALLEQDYSDTRRYLTALVASGVTDLDAHLAARPEVLQDAVSRVRTVRVNQQALKLFDAPDAEAIQALTAAPSPATLAWFRASLCQMLAGERRFAREARTQTLSGATRTLSTQLHVLPGQGESWSRVVVSVFDLTSHERVEAQLRASLHDKEVLLKEVHHRVKNNLQIVSSLLNLKAAVFDDPAMRLVFSDCQARIQSLAFVHEQLYVSGNLSLVPFGHYVRTLVDHLRSSCGKPDRQIDSHIEIADIYLSIDEAIPCGLIVNELVTNSLKHAFAPHSNGLIEVRMRKLDSQRLELVVSDNGRGLPPEFEPPRSESSGLELVYTFAEQLRADVVIERTAGTRFQFRFAPEARLNVDHARG